MKILIADDEESIRALLTIQLEKNGYDTMTAEDGEEALRLAKDADLLLLDVMMPKRDGFAVCQALRADPQTEHLPILMLTARQEEIDKVLGLELGADDYLAKPFSLRELLARIKALLRRSQGKEPRREGCIACGPLSIDIAAHQATLAGTALSLTPKEFDLLKLLVTNPGRAFTRDDLLSRIWGYDYAGDTRTVDVHIRHLRGKMAAVPELAAAIATVHGVGYRFQASPT